MSRIRKGEWRVPVQRPRAGDKQFGLKLALTYNWAITQLGLQNLLAIASRTHDLDKLAAMEQQRGQKLENTHEVTVRDGVAIIPISGPLFAHADMFSRISGATSFEQLHLDLRAALDSPGIGAILLNISSPGGEVEGTESFASAVRDARGQKPIWAYVEGEACSAAYWIASAAERIVTSRTGLLGNIGVIAGVANPHYTPDGGQPPSITILSSQSPNKRPDPTTAEGYARIQGTLDAVCSVFLQDVADNRGLGGPEAVVEAGDGGDIFVGQGAVDRRLADAVGGFEDTLAQLADTVWADQPTPLRRAAANGTELVAQLAHYGQGGITAEGFKRVAQAVQSLQYGDGRWKIVGGAGMADLVDEAEVVDEVAVAEDEEQEEAGALEAAASAAGDTTDATAALRLRIAALEDERGALLMQNQKLADRISKLNAQMLADEAEREVSGASNDGIPWRGDAKANAKKYIRMKSAFGADKEGFAEYVADQRLAARALEQSGIFGERGSDAPSTPTGNAKAELEQAGTAIRAEHLAAGKAISLEEAMVEAMHRNPELAKRL